MSRSRRATAVWPRCACCLYLRDLRSEWLRFYSHYEGMDKVVEHIAFHSNMENVSLRFMRNPVCCCCCCSAALLGSLVELKRVRVGRKRRLRVRRILG